MNITGIYALYWWEQDLVYIGQSQNINKRYKEHLSALDRNKHANPKISIAYKKYGFPDLIILETCNIEELYLLEILWTKEFDSLNVGLNIVEPGPSGFGINSSQSKYTKTQVLKVFALLTNTNLANIDIANRVKVSMSLVQSIRNRYSHIWLKDAYPERYAKLTNKTRTQPTYGRKLGGSLKFTCPKGIVYTTDSVSALINTIKNIYSINNITSFASGLRRLVRQEQNSYQGWTVKLPEFAKTQLDFAS